MSQALKVIKFNSDKDDNNEVIINESNSLSKSLVLIPLKIAAIFTAILGVLALVFEVRMYFDLRYEIYLARLFPTLFSLFTLILLQTNFGKKNQIFLAHVFLSTIIISLSFVLYKVPSLYLLSIVAATLFVLVLAIFFNWGIKNQIILVSYFSLLFGISIISANILIFSDINTFLPLGTIFILLLISVLISNLRNKFPNVDDIKVVSSLHSDGITQTNSQDFPIESMDESIIPMFQIAFDGKIKMSNLAFISLLNISKNQSLSELNFFDDCIKNENVKKHILKKLESKGKIENYRLKIIGKDNKAQIFDMDCQTRIIDNEHFFEGVIKNVTNQYLKEKILTNELEKLKKIKSKLASSSNDESNNHLSNTNFLSNMGHELKTPINSILGFLTLIENGHFVNEAELKEFSRNAKFSADSLLRIINDLVEISKIEDGLAEIANSEFNIREAVDNTISNLTPIFLQKDLSHSCDIGNNVPEKIYSDSSKYSLILSNLLCNAIQVSDNGILKITIDQHILNNGKKLLITSVEDSSEGIPKDQLEKILDDNYDIKNEEKNISTNILHLSICKELTKLLDGSITVTSEFNKGNKITFSISIESIDDKNENLISEGFNNLNKFTRAKLLLVEDNPISRKVEQKLLQKAGYDVDCVDNGSDAIKMIQKGEHNLVLMDIGLKDMNGLVATKKIRELPGEVNSIPIIAVTAHSSMKDREKCLLAGMNDYISKPININFLKMTIDQWLNSVEEI